MRAAGWRRWLSRVRATGLKEADAALGPSSQDGVPGFSASLVTARQGAPPGLGGGLARPASMRGGPVLRDAWLRQAPRHEARGWRGAARERLRRLACRSRKAPTRRSAEARGQEPKAPRAGRRRTPLRWSGPPLPLSHARPTGGAGTRHAPRAPLSFSSAPAARMPRTRPGRENDRARHPPRKAFAERSRSDDPRHCRPI
jgi:hypothetical protein